VLQEARVLLEQVVRRPQVEVLQVELLRSELRLQRRLLRSELRLPQRLCLEGRLLFVCSCC
jgi:hypothetical protein